MNKDSFSTIKWMMTIGITPGYTGINSKEFTKDELAETYRRLAAEVEEETSVYISCVFYESRTVYKAEWGCPSEGEKTYTLTGCCNTEFSDLETYSEALKKMAEKLKKCFKQSTVLLEVMPMMSIYLE